ncbi:MAG TPA: hypothetical protein VGL69_15175 [Solirubrobacteraceae bacterium]|jgi:hypothetical protein
MCDRVAPANPAGDPNDPAGGKTMLLRLAAITQKLISPQQPLKLTVVVIAHDSAGAHATQRVPLYLFPPRKSRPRKFG